MNCKPGDLAVIVPPYHEDYVGLFVVVREFAPPGTKVVAKSGAISRTRGDFGPTWICDANNADFPHVVADNALRPIRKQGDEVRDEMLRPLPKEVTA